MKAIILNGLGFVSKPLYLFRRRWLILGIVSLLITLNLSPVFSQTSDIPQNTIEQLQQQSQIYSEQGKLIQAIEKLQELINKLSSQGKKSENLAIAWMNSGMIQLAIGQPEAAFKSWQNAAQIYTKLGNNNAVFQLQIYQAKALQKMGHYLQGCEILTQTLQITSRICQSQTIKPRLIYQKIEEFKSLELFAIYLDGWRILSDNLRLLGKLKEAKTILEFLATTPLNLNPKLTQLSLGNLLRAMGNLERDRQAEPNYKYLPWQCKIVPLSQEIIQKFYEPSLFAYEKASQSHSITTKTNAQLNQFSLLVELGRWPAAKSLLNQIDLRVLPPSQSRVFSQINYAQNLACLYQQENFNINNVSEKITSILEAAKKDAENLSLNFNHYLLSYVLGNLGSFYESIGDRLDREDYREKAIQLTQEALYVAQPQAFPHIAYQWQWQLGRLLGAKGDKIDAIAAYELAVKTLETVRKDLLVINSDVQFSFRDRVEPLYRQLVELLISTDNLQNNQIILSKSIYYLEALQVAELENFLQCRLTETRALPFIQPSENLNEKLEKVLSQDKTTSLIYPILLENQIVVIFKRLDRPIKYYITKIAHKVVEKNLNDLQDYLTQPDRIREIQRLSAQFYDWLIQPLEKDLEREIERDNSQIKTLVFVLDTSLRNLPMSVLYDKKQNLYLLQRYALAVISSSQLLKSAGYQRNINPLLGGLSQAITIGETNYPFLENVPDELNKIQAVTINSIELLDRAFTKSNLERQLQKNNFSVVHLATHGQFSSDPEETFIILYDERLKAQDLTRLLTSRQPLQLLVLSGCETATGDRRALLGLAGVAIRAEALTSLGTLWQVNDESTAVLMSYFYRYLSENPQISKAEALRKAQLKLLENKQKLWNRPLFWAAYVLVGNWL